MAATGRRYIGNCQIWLSPGQKPYNYSSITIRGKAGYFTHVVSEVTQRGNHVGCSVSDDKLW